MGRSRYLGAELNRAPLRKPPRIRSADVVGVIAPAGVADGMARGLSERSAARLHALLTDPACFWEAEAPVAIRPGRATGRLVGGCLAGLAAALATRWARGTDGAIGFVEDGAGRRYRLD